MEIEECHIGLQLNMERIIEEGKGITFYILPLNQTDQMVSVALYNLTPGKDSPNLGMSHHLEVIRADWQLNTMQG